MSLEHIENCPICGHNTFELHLQATDFTVTKEVFSIVKCKNCAFLFTNPRPDSRSIGSYYQSENYISHHSEKTDLFTITYNQIRKYTTTKKLDLLSQGLKTTKPSILDYGCGTGYFLKACQANGWHTEGIEPDSDASAIASKDLGHTIYSSPDAAPFKPGQFDFITLWHVLEHIHELNDMLSFFHKLLDNHGTMAIAVPNPDALDAKKFGSHWAAYDLPRHLYHFTQETMTAILSKHQFTVTEIHPMWFDSFYVSLLSTKNKYGQIKPIESVKAGLASNIAGKKTKTNTFNTSSLIYIVRKTTN